MAAVAGVVSAPITIPVALGASAVVGVGALAGNFISDRRASNRSALEKKEVVKQFITQLEELEESGRSSKGNKALNYLNDLVKRNRWPEAYAYVERTDIESCKNKNPKPKIDFDPPPTPPSKPINKVNVVKNKKPPVPTPKAKEKSKEKPKPWDGCANVVVTSTGIPFYIVDGYGSKSFGISSGSTGGKPLAVVRGYYDGDKAEVHVHLTPSGKRYDAHTGANVKIGEGAYSASWGAGNVSGAADLNKILDKGFSSWWMPGSYLTKQTKKWI